MGIKRLLIDSRIQGVWTVWYGHTKTGPDRHRDKEEAACSSMCSGLMTVAASDLSDLRFYTSSLRSSKRQE